MDIINRKDVGQRVRMARVAAYYRLSQLADAIGVGHSVMSRLELRGQGITVERLKKIAETLDVPVDQLTGYSPSVQEKPQRAGGANHQHLVEVPIHEVVLRESPSKTSLEPLGIYRAPAWAVPGETAGLYVWRVNVEHMPPGFLWGDYVLIEWQDRVAARHLVGKMAVGYREDEVVLGRVGPCKKGYSLHDDQVNGRAIVCDQIELYGFVRWSWRNY